MERPSTSPPVAIWAGLECTVNRVGDAFYDQVERTGHHERSGDIELLVGLGVAALRYPVLWERACTHADGDPDFSWTDERMTALRRRGVAPIIGLIHHGSGPPGTDLLAPGFAESFARYAGAAAARYPWVRAWTPVNEPLTTARFSALYGHWYPHRTDDLSFCRALLSQCKATVLGMRAIRRVVPGAALVSTEDLGSVSASPALAYQAAFENDRRWLGLDLLCGLVSAAHPMRKWMAWVGVPDADIEWFRENPCPPDVMGLNYYLTSERWLDEDWARWPAWSHGGNERHRYADVHAVMASRQLAPERLIEAAWRRFGIPIALTEVHLGGLREEQLRWLIELYQAARRARSRGVDVRAVTAWAAFGSFDWHRLCTTPEGFYEPGLFDIRGPEPRPTALAHAVRALAAGRMPDHPVLARAGRWHSERLSC